jgi:hypothetical protein
VDSKNIVCHVNSSACRVYVTSFYSTTSISFYKSFYTFVCLCTFYSYIFAAIFVYIFVHPRLHSSVDAQRRFYSTPTLICGRTAVSTVLQLHLYGHFRVHFRTSTPTFICGRTATLLFYTYTHLWMYSVLYSATATFVRPFSCTFSYIHVYIHLWTHSDVSILHLHSSVDAQRSLQCYSYIFAVIFTTTFSRPLLCTFSYIHAYIHRGPSLALFSRWQRVHGYTSLIRPRLHSSLHSLHSTSTLSEHFRDPGVYIRPTFYIYI